MYFLSHTCNLCLFYNLYIFFYNSKAESLWKLLKRNLHERGQESICCFADFSSFFLVIVQLDFLFNLIIIKKYINSFARLCFINLTGHIIYFWFCKKTPSLFAGENQLKCNSFLINSICCTCRMRKVHLHYFSEQISVWLLNIGEYHLLMFSFIYNLFCSCS